VFVLSQYRSADSSGDRLMTPEAYGGETSDGQDLVLAQLLNDALEALQAGRSDDVDALLAQWPQYANELQSLVSVWPAHWSSLIRCTAK
jgi:hypothetical protein